MSSSDRLSLSAAIIERLKPAAVVELGCGGGALAQAIAQRVAGVRYTGIDRSALAVARATQRNQRLVAAGVAEFVCADFMHPKEAGDRHRGYDVCCAVNVNGFWTDPSRAFAAAAAFLTQGSRLVLVFEAPGAEKAAAIARTLRDAAPESFRIEQQIGPEGKTVAITYRFAARVGHAARRPASTKLRSAPQPSHRDRQRFRHASPHLFRSPTPRPMISRGSGPAAAIG